MGISVAMAIHRLNPGLPRAVESILQQTVRDLDIMLIVNGGDASAASGAAAIARRDNRIRVLHSPHANLAAALNLGLLHARHELVARMDDDDACPPERLALQERALRANSSWVAVGGAWDMKEPDGRVRVTMRPPCDPVALRWRLLQGNVLAHGSMMVRRSVVIAAGGYDTRLTKAQDYDLWLRLSRVCPLGAVREVIYTHHLRAGGGWCTSGEQAAIAAALMQREWALLPPGNEAIAQAALASGLASDGGAGGAPREAFDALQRSLPTRETFAAWMWSRWFRPAPEFRAAEACRGARLREIGATLRSAGAQRVWLWGAGNHTRWVLEHRRDLGVEIAGIVDDARPGEAAFGFVVDSPENLPRGAWVLISSDAFEEEIWERSARQRARGVHVIRMYDDQAAAPSVAEGLGASARTMGA